MSILRTGLPIAILFLLGCSANNDDSLQIKQTERLTKQLEQSAQILTVSMHYCLEDVYNKSTGVLTDDTWSRVETGRAIAELTTKTVAAIDTCINNAKTITAYGSSSYVATDDKGKEWLKANNAKIVGLMQHYKTALDRIAGQGNAKADSVWAVCTTTNWLQETGQVVQNNAGLFLRLQQLKNDVLLVGNTTLRVHLLSIPIYCMLSMCETYITAQQSHDEIKAGKTLKLNVGINLFQRFSGSQREKLLVNGQEVQQDERGGFTAVIDTRGKTGKQKAVIQYSFPDMNTGKPATVWKEIEYTVIP
jgi:hypothetical protein